MSAPDQPQANADKRQSVRIILEGLILAGIVWMANSMQQQITSIAKLQVQMDQMTIAMANMPDLATRITRIEQQVTDLQRRQDADDQRHAHLEDASQQNRSLKGWTR